MKIHKLLPSALLALASCATTPPPAAVAPVPRPPREIETRWVRIDTEPEGAGIIVNGYNHGYSPVDLGFRVYADTGEVADTYYIRAYPTSPGQLTQDMYLTSVGIGSNQSLTLFMYNTK